MMDDWGCVSEEDLFFSAGATKSLDELVESLTSSGVIEEDLNQPRIFSLANGLSQNVEVVSCGRERPQNGFAPKILKKRTGFAATNNQRPNLKRVTFEVEKFVADESTESAERENARARLAIQLGAEPEKTPYINYKDLKTELVAKKLAPQNDEKHSALLALKAPIFKKKAAKAKKTRK